MRRASLRRAEKGLRRLAREVAEYRRLKALHQRLEAEAAERRRLKEQQRQEEERHREELRRLLEEERRREAARSPTWRTEDTPEGWRWVQVPPVEATGEQQTAPATADGPASAPGSPDAAAASTGAATGGPAPAEAGPPSQPPAPPPTPAHKPPYDPAAAWSAAEFVRRRPEREAPPASMFRFLGGPGPPGW
jgi:hypothetical protein